jgi:hypothetical protein
VAKNSQNDMIKAWVLKIISAKKNENITRICYVLLLGKIYIDLGNLFATCSTPIFTN